MIARHGTGSVLVTDQRRSFTSVFFKETCKNLGIKQGNTSAYHPQANGTIKLYHKTTNQGLSHYVNASGTNWDTLVPFYLMATKQLPMARVGIARTTCYTARNDFANFAGSQSEIIT